MIVNSFDIEINNFYIFKMSQKIKVNFLSVPLPNSLYILNKWKCF